jgi:SAM-dependent methyltransferase
MSRIQLYERVAGATKLGDATVLEIGSGRGGGASYVARYRQPRSMLGVDYSREAVLFCESRHAGVSNLDFDFGDAENLPLPNAAFDAVINVESSHCYGNILKFFSEVARVLRPGGHFLFADLREPAEMETLRACLKSTPGFELLEEEDITAGVAMALEADDARKRSLIDALVPTSIRPLFQEFAGVCGGQVHESLKKRTLVYSRFIIRKVGH